MKIREFIDYYQPGMSEYCPVVIAYDGEIYECKEGHLHCMLELSGNSKMLEEIPKDVAPLFFMIEKLKCVVVDFENQIAFDRLTKEQEDAIEQLAKKGLIQNNLKIIHKQNVSIG